MNLEEIPGLTGTERIVLGTISVSPRPLCRRDVMERLGLGDKTVRNALTSLSTKGLLTDSAEGQTKFYAYRDPGTMVKPPVVAPPTPVPANPAEEPATPVTEGLVGMSLAQVQNAVIDAWCRGAKIPLVPAAARGPLYDAAAMLGRAIQQGVYSLDDVRSCTRDKVSDPYRRKRTNTWTLGVIAREIYLWKQARERRQTYTNPPADFKAGLDPQTGLHRVWDHQRGCPVEVELAPIPVHQPRRAPVSAARPRPALEGVWGERFQQDHGRSTFSIQHYMVPSRTIITADDDNDEED